MTNKTRICSIDFFRYFCSIIVIGIHTSVLNDISSVAGEVFLDVFSRIAVPFFFAVSGYFYIQKLEHNKKVFKNYFIRLIVTYSAWSIVYFILDFITWGHINLKGFVTNCLYSYFIIGSHYHLWFLHSLILCICLVTVFYKLHIQKILVPISLVTFTIGCLGSAYYNVIGKSIPFLNSIFDSSFYVQIKHFPLFSLSFFVCGYVIYRMHKKFEKATNKKINKIVILSVFSAIIWLSEIILIKNKNLGRDTTITIGLYFLIISIITFA